MDKMDKMEKMEKSKNAKKSKGKKRVARQQRQEDEFFDDPEASPNVDVENDVFLLPQDELDRYIKNKPGKSPKEKTPKHKRKFMKGGKSPYLPDEEMLGRNDSQESPARIIRNNSEEDPPISSIAAMQAQAFMQQQILQQQQHPMLQGGRGQKKMQMQDQAKAKKMQLMTELDTLNGINQGVNAGPFGDVMGKFIDENEMGGKMMAPSSYRLQGDDGKESKEEARAKIMTSLSRMAIRRLARRGGVKRISAKIYKEAREVLAIFMEKVLTDTVTYVLHGKRSTVKPVDIVNSLKRQGRNIYGYGT